VGGVVGLGIKKSLDAQQFGSNWETDCGLGNPNSRLGILNCFTWKLVLFTPLMVQKSRTTTWDGAKTL